MSSVLIVGGDHVDGIKQAVSTIGISETHHWTGRKAGDSHKAIPHNTRFIVMVTGFINHSFTYSIKRAAAKRGLTVIYTSTNAKKLQTKLEQLGSEMSLADACRKTLCTFLYIIRRYLVGNIATSLGVNYEDSSLKRGYGHAYIGGFCGKKLGTTATYHQRENS